MGEGDAPVRRLRLFVAVDLPEAVLDVVDAACASWRGSIPGVRWSRRESWHVTLKFLGGVAPDRVDVAAELIARAATEVTPFETRLTALGAFPAGGRARVVWAGLDDRSGRLAGLALGIDAALAETVPPERRPLHPHITVGRCDPAVRLPPGFVDAPLEPAPFTVDRVGLFRSHLGGGPARYERLRSLPLARP